MTLLNRFSFIFCIKFAPSYITSYIKWILSYIKLACKYSFSLLCEIIHDKLMYRLHTHTRIDEWRSKSITIWGGGHLGRSTITHVGHRGYTYLELSLQGHNPYLVGFNLNPISFEFLPLGSFGCLKGLDLLVDVDYYGVYHYLHLSTKLFKSPPWTLAPQGASLCYPPYPLGWPWNC